MQASVGLVSGFSHLDVRAVRLVAAVYFALLLAGPSCHAFVVSGSVVDSDGRPIANMKVALADGWGGLDAVFDESVLETDTDVNGRFRVDTDWQRYDWKSFHVITYSDEHFGEVFNWDYRVPGSGKVELCIVCGPRYTLSVKPLLPVGLAPEDGRCMVVPRPDSARPRVHVVPWPKDGVLSFPFGVPTLEAVLCLADPVSKDIPKDGELATRGWMARGDARSIKSGETVSVQLHDFRAFDADKADPGREPPLLLRIPKRENTFSLIGLNEEGEVLWHESIEGFWNAHVESATEPDADGSLRELLTVHPGEQASTLVLWNAFSEEECLYDLSKTSRGKWLDLEWSPVEREKRFTVRLPKDARPQWTDGGKLVVYIRYGVYFNIRTLGASEHAELDFAMPSVIDEVTVEVPQAWPNSESPVWRTRAVRGKAASLPDTQLARFSLTLRGPSGVAMAWAKFQVRRAGESGESKKAERRIFWIQLGKDSSTIVYLEPGMRYEVLVGERWVTFTAKEGVDELELTPWPN